MMTQISVGSYKKKIELSVEKVLTPGEIYSEIEKYLLKSVDVASRKVLIVCEDVTRDTPVHTFFPRLFDNLFPRSKELMILFALGTHRPMVQEEMLKKLGMRLEELKGVEMVNHNAYDLSELVDIDVIDGVPLRLNRLVEESDVLISLGSVLPHRVMGFAGGAKMLCPGVGNKEMIDYTHMKSNEYAEELIMAVANNPMRQLMDRVSDVVEKKFPEKKFISVNCVPVSGGVAGIFVGSFRDSYRRAAELSSEVYVKEVKRCKSVLAILDDKCVDFWQGAKAVYNCARVIKDGGIIVVYGSLKEGISTTHGQAIETFGYSTPKKLKELVDKGIFRDTVVASHMMRVSEYLQRMKIFLSSPNLDEEQCRKVNLGYIHPQDISKMSFDYVVYNPVDVVLKTT